MRILKIPENKNDCKRLPCRLCYYNFLVLNTNRIIKCFDLNKNSFDIKS